MNSMNHYLPKVLKGMLVVCFMLVGILLHAQENKVAIKLKKVEDGKEIMVDTVLTNASHEEIDAILEKYDVVMHNVLGDEQINVEDINGNKRVIIKSGDGATENIWISGDHDKVHVGPRAKKFMRHKDSPKVFMGIVMDENIKVEVVNGEETVTGSNDGVLIRDIMDDSPAEKAGLQKDDIIKSIDGKAIANGKELTDFLRKKNPGDVIQVQVSRNAAITNISLTLEERKNMPMPSFEFEIDEDTEGNSWFDKDHNQAYGLHQGSKAFLGVQLGRTVDVEIVNGEKIVTETPESNVNGAFVSKVVEEGPAVEAGLLDNDVIIAMDDTAISSEKDLLTFMKDKNPGDVVKVTVHRNGNQKKFNVTLGEKEHFPVHFKRKMFREKDGAFGPMENMDIVIDIEDFDGEVPEIMKIWEDKDGKVHGIHNGEIIFLSGEDGEMVHEFEIETNENGNVVRKHVVIKVKVEDLEETDKENLEDPSFKIDNTLNLERLAFYPNPNDGSFNLSFITEERGDLSIKVTNISGKEVFAESLLNFEGQYDKVISLPEASDGLYIVQIAQNGKIVNKKVAIQR